MREVLHPGDGGRDDDARAEVVELEAAAVGDALGVQDVLVAAEGLDGQGVGGVALAGAGQRGGARGGGGVLGVPVQRRDVGPRPRRAAGGPEGAHEVLPQAAGARVVEPRGAAPHGAGVLGRERQGRLDGGYGAGRARQGPDEGQGPRVEAEVRRGEEPLRGAGLRLLQGRVRGARVREGRGLRVVVVVEGEDGVGDVRG